MREATPLSEATPSSYEESQLWEAIQGNAYFFVSYHEKKLYCKEQNLFRDRSMIMGMESSEQV